MTKSTRSSETLLDTYRNFLNTYQIHLRDINATNIFNRFKLIRSGINNLHLTETQVKSEIRKNISLKEEVSQLVRTQSIQIIPYGQRPTDWGTDPKVIYGWGNISSVTKVPSVYLFIFP
ncbi:hypothetical protein LOAG_00984 [Loa loa]|uniref:Uncharacterized protein n=1 Tax=Loa loa TaxID=7209 RepID=A0A1S0UA81_LOALO|nr:hypothetical protein LOAG_00984 [Loa loa]EFO27492.1 hypothetical protein LOAG_00984 [Loa loa]